MNTGSWNKYDSLNRTHPFSISKAIMGMLENNIELNEFVKGDFDLAVIFTIKAWNIAIVNDSKMIKLLVTYATLELKNKAGKSLKQTETMLYSLIKWKNSTYGDIYRSIEDYSSDPDANGQPYLKVASGKDMPADYFANKYRKLLIGKV